jgi:hypothetical protein
MLNAVAVCFHTQRSITSLRLPNLKYQILNIKFMLSPQQINSIADQINAKVDLPFLGENQEKALLMTILGQVGNLVATVVPKQHQAALGDPNQGIDKTEATKIGNDLMSQITSKIDMGMLGSIGKNIAGTFVESIVNGLQKGGKV